MEICPVTRQLLYEIIMEPFLQGISLMDQAWKGEDRSLVHHRFSLKERLIHWLQGAALVILFPINIIIWLAWKTFGKPEKLFDAFSSETTHPLSTVPVRGAIPQGPIAEQNAVKVVEGQVKPSEEFRYVEAAKTTLETEWTIEHFSELIIAKQNCTQFESTALYHPDLKLKRYHYTMGAKRYVIWQEDDHPDRVFLEISKEDGSSNKWNLSLDKLPLIQQRMIGLRPFLKSKDTELKFCAVVPEVPFSIPFILKAPFIVPAIAKKIGEEIVPGYGKLLKVEVASTWKWPYNTFKTELWFDLETGQLKKFIDSGKFIPTKTGEFRPKYLSP